ncbi:MAG: sigma-54-dependent Fis family transcriptional regulator [Deltaproteobacteria bacterium]|jgi:two-component system C4-dicarboxylate transport response regulator DctD|nr:sigma-54-dependent Fis family transcriptional regulator [Deltaproteobacteria bacterium]
MSRKSKILVVDDDPFSLDLLRQELEHLGHDINTCTNGKKAIEKIISETSKHGFPGIIVTDIRMPGMDGIELMKRTIDFDPDLPVILITAYGDISMAVQAMRDGAYDFIEKPIDSEKLIDVVKRGMEKRSLVLDNRRLRAELVSKSGLDTQIIGKSPLTIELRGNIANLADTNASVLVLGETGTGKDLVAQCLHEFSSRSGNNFVPVNCGAIPENIFESELFGHEAGAFTGATKRRIGRIEHSHGGTLFLDEIESMPRHLQVKLLRTLEERVIERLGSNEQISVDFRVVSATKADLKEAVRKGDFREDLYFRLNVAEVVVPPLRSRRDDVPLLFEYFAEKLAFRYKREAPQLSQKDLHELIMHSWPGNVRELKNVAERAVIGMGTQKPSVAEIIHPATQPPLTLSEQVEIFEKQIIETSLSDNNGSIQDTMETLGIARRTLNEKMRKYGLDRKDYV